MADSRSLDEGYGIGGSYDNDDYGGYDGGLGGSGFGMNCSDYSKFFDDMRSFYTPSMIVVPSIYCIICLVGLIGNGLVSDVPYINHRC